MLILHDPSDYHGPLHSNVRKQHQLHQHRFPAFCLLTQQHNLYLMQVVYHVRQGSNVHKLFQVLRVLRVLMRRRYVYYGCEHRRQIQDPTYEAQSYSFCSFLLLQEDLDF